MTDEAAGKSGRRAALTALAAMAAWAALALFAPWGGAPSALAADAAAPGAAPATATETSPAAAPAPGTSPAPEGAPRRLVFGVVAGAGFGSKDEAGSLAADQGFDAEALAALGKAMGAEIKMRPGKWEDLAAALDKGDIDAIGGVAVAGDLARRYRFTLPHRQVRAVCLTVQDAPPITTVRDTFGLRAAVAKHSPEAAMLTASGCLDKCKPTFCEGATDALDAVMERRVDLAWMSQAQAQTLQREFAFYRRYTRMSEPLLAAPYACAVRLGDAALAERIDRGWLRLRLNGTLERLNRKWFAAPAPRPLLEVAIPETACGANDRILSEVGRRLGLQVEVVPVPVPDTLRFMLRPERGYAATVVVEELAARLSPEWKRLAGDAHPTGVRVKVTAFLAPDWPGGDDPAALRGARVGINRQFACLEPAVEARAGGAVAWTRMDDDSDMERLLLANQLDAWVVPEEFARHVAAASIRRVDLAEFAEKVAFRRDQQALADACGEALTDMRNDGTQASILEGGASQPESRKRVMFIHSFGGDFSPFYETGRHIVRELARQQAQIEHEYLEISAHDSIEGERGKLLAAHLRRVHAGRHHDLVIAEDYPALEFVRRYHEQLFYRVPVYAYGVGGELRKVLEATSEATGMVEEISAEDTFKLIRRLHPDMKRLYVVNDYSPAGQAVREAIARQIGGLARQAGCALEHGPNVPVAELRALMQSLDQHTVVLFGSYITDVASGQTVDREAFRSLMERLPVYGVFDRYQGVGQIGGRLVAPSAPGDDCMAAINRLLAGNPPASVPIYDSSAGNRWIFSGAALRRHGVSQGGLPKGATVTVDDAPPPAAWGLGTPQALAAAFALLVLLVVILLWAVARAPVAGAAPPAGRPALRRWKGLVIAALLTLPLALFYQVAAAQVMARLRENLCESAGRVAGLMRANQRAAQAEMLGIFGSLLATVTDAPEEEKVARLRAFVNRAGAVEAAWLRPDGSGFATGGKLAANLAGEDFVRAARGGRTALSSLRSRALSRGSAPAGGVLVTAVPVPATEGKPRLAGVALLAQSYQVLGDVFQAGPGLADAQVLLLDGAGQAVAGGRDGAPKALSEEKTAETFRGPGGLVQNLSAIFPPPGAGDAAPGEAELLINGEPHLCGFCRVPGTDWVALVAAPRAALSRALLPLKVLAGALALVLLAGVAVLFWRAQRMQAVTQAANKALKRDRDNLAARNSMLERETRDLAKQAETARDVSRGHGMRLEELRNRLMALLDDGSGAPATAWGGHADMEGVCAALADRLAWYRALIDNTAAPMVVLDAHKNLLFGNAAWRRAEGQMPLETFVRAYEAFPADGGYDLAAGAAGPGAAEGGAGAGAEGRDPQALCIHDEERGRWLQMRVAWIANRAGERRSCLVSAEDVTLAHQREDDLRRLADRLPIGCVFHDLVTMDVSYANPALLRMLSLDNPNEYGLRWREYFAPVQPGGQGALDVHLELLARLKRDGQAGGDIVCRNARGEDVPCRLDVVLCGDRAVFFVRDLRPRAMDGEANGAGGAAGAPGAWR